MTATSTFTQLLNSDFPVIGMPCLYADMLVATWKWTNSLLCFSSRSRWYLFFENRKQPFMKTGRKGGKMKCGIRLELHLVFKAKLAVQFLFFKCASVTLESVGMPWGSIYIYIYVVIACNSKQLPWSWMGGGWGETIYHCLSLYFKKFYKRGSLNGLSNLYSYMNWWWCCIGF